MTIHLVHAKVNTRWVEVAPTWTQYDIDQEFQFHDATKQKRLQPRKLVWYGRYDEQMTWRCCGPSKSTSTLQQQQTLDPHPLRTDLWKLNIHWKDDGRGKGLLQGILLPKKATPAVIEFHPNGYCKSIGLGIGMWEVFPWGVRCTLQDDAARVEYILYADLHLNPFGDQPKMLQGTILKQEYNSDGNKNSFKGHHCRHYQEDPIQDHFFVKQRKKWFRPVVATFSGRGIGVDTADLAYKSRGIGLY